MTVVTWIWQLWLCVGASAAEPSVWWTPSHNAGDGSGGETVDWSVGRHGVAVGDVDGDGVLDAVTLIETFDTDESVQNRLVYRIGGVDYVFPIADEIGEARLSMADLDGDGEQEVLLGLPEAADGQGVFRAYDPKTTAGSLNPTRPAVPMQLAASNTEAMGASYALLNLDGDQFVEAAVAGPSRLTAGSVALLRQLRPLVPNAEGEVELQWTSTGMVTGFAAGVVVLDDELVFAVCARAGDGCVQAGSIVTHGIIAPEPPVLSFGPPQLLSVNQTEYPLHFVVAPDVNADDSDDLLWSTRRRKVFIDRGGSILATVTASGEGVAFERRDDGGTTWWMQDGAKVLVLDGVTEGAAVAQAVDVIELPGHTLGMQITPAGDLDGDGCGDALASVSEGTSIYLLPGPCFENLDTDVETDAPPETDEPGDTDEPPDSDSPAETDTDVPTDKPRRDRPLFGWSCATSPAAPGGGVALWALVLGFGLRRRRRDG